MLPKQLIQRMQCPHCAEAGTIVFQTENMPIRQAECRACSHRFTARGGIPDFAEHLPVDDPQTSPAQRLMNSNLFAMIYESIFWRQLHTLVGSGLTVSAETRAVLEFHKGKQAGSVLDLACGTGHYARAFARRFPDAEICGIDISPAMLGKAQRIASRKKLEHIIYLRGDIYRLPFTGDSFDILHCGGALHLFPDLAPVWHEIARLLKPGGTFTAMTIARVAGRIGGFQQRLMSRGQATFFNPERLAASLEKVGLSAFRYQTHRLTLLFSVTKTN